MRGPFGLRVVAARYVRLLHRILHRFFKMLIGDLEVMFSGDRFGIAKPSTHDVRRELFFQFRLPSRSEILEQLRPRLQSSTLDNSYEFSSMIS